MLITKPMEVSLAACDALITKAEDKGLLLGIDFEQRFTRDILVLKKAVDVGFFGRLLSGQASAKIRRTTEYYRRNGGWRGTKRWDGGGVLSNQNIHTLDELAFTIGIPLKVRCDTWAQTHDIEGEDLGVATWLYEDRMIVTLYATTSYPQPTWYSRTELHGTEGALCLAWGGPMRKPETLWYSDGEWNPIPPLDVEVPWTSAADNFAAALRTGAQLVCSGRDGRRSQAILDAMYRSAYAGGGWVSVEPELPW